MFHERRKWNHARVNHRKARWHAKKLKTETNSVVRLPDDSEGELVVPPSYGIESRSSYSEGSTVVNVRTVATVEGHTAHSEVLRCTVQYFEL